MREKEGKEKGGVKRKEKEGKRGIFFPIYNEMKGGGKKPIKI